MVINLVNFLISCAIAIYFMLPAYVSNLSGLAFGGGTPMDKGKTLSDGYRIIGNGVTWKGFISGTILGTLVGGIQGFLSINLTQISGGIITLNVFQSIPNGLILGFILAFGALLGDAVGSFIKRRLGISSETCTFLRSIRLRNNVTSFNIIHSAFKYRFRFNHSIYHFNFTFKFQYNSLFTWNKRCLVLNIKHLKLIFFQNITLKIA